MYRKIIKFLLLISWMSVIFYFSNQKAEQSSELSNSFIVKVTKIIVGNKLDGDKQEEIIEKYVTVVRKGAHAFIYFVLSLIAFSFLKEFYGKSNKTLVYTILFCFCYSVSDEFHQLFIEGRSGELRDIVIDTLSSSLGVFINYKFRFLKRK